MVKANHLVGCIVPPSGGTSFLVGAGIGIVWHGDAAWLVVVAGGLNRGAAKCVEPKFGHGGHLGGVCVAICLAHVDFGVWGVGCVAALAR